VATYAVCVGICSDQFTANLPKNLEVKKKFENRLSFDRIIAEIVISFWPTLYIAQNCPWVGLIHGLACIESGWVEIFSFWWVGFVWPTITKVGLLKI